MIIFGWGHRKTHNLGPVEKRQCPRCHNVDFWELHQLKDYFSLFFIPVVPYKSDHFLVCPICHAGEPLEGPRLEQARRQAEANLARIRGGR